MSAPGPGIHKIPAAEYHADPCETPSLSASVAAILCSQTPAHAQAAHPRLNPDLEREEKESYDIGTAAHAMLLELEDVVTIVDADNWRTKAAQDARDEARAAGKVPLLSGKADLLAEMLAVTLERLRDVQASPGLLVHGKPEQTVIWEEDGVLCRALCDWLHDDYIAIDDLKTTSRSANPGSWARAAFEHGSDIQAAFYRRGVKAVTGVEPEFRFIVAETARPFGVAVLTPSPDVMAVADAKVDYAIKRWRTCLETGDWPAYSTRIHHFELTPWEEPRWMEKLALEEMAA